MGKEQKRRLKAVFESQIKLRPLLRSRRKERSYIPHAPVVLWSTPHLGHGRIGTEKCCPLSVVELSLARRAFVMTFIHHSLQAVYTHI